MIKNELSIDHKAYLDHIIPTLYVSYNRQYYENFHGLRITVDEDIRFKSNFSSSISINQLAHISYRSKIVELKFDPSLKNEVSHLLRSLSLTPIRHSKYLTGLAMHGQAQYI